MKEPTLGTQLWLEVTKALLAAVFVLLVQKRLLEHVEAKDKRLLRESEGKDERQLIFKAETETRTARQKCLAEMLVLAYRWQDSADNCLHSHTDAPRTSSRLQGEYRTLKATTDRTFSALLPHAAEFGRVHHESLSLGMPLATLCNDLEKLVRDLYRRVDDRGRRASVSDFIEAVGKIAGTARYLVKDLQSLQDVERWHLTRGDARLDTSPKEALETCTVINSEWQREAQTNGGLGTM